MQFMSGPHSVLAIDYLPVNELSQLPRAIMMYYNVARNFITLFSHIDCDNFVHQVTEEATYDRT